MLGHKRLEALLELVYSHFTSIPFLFLGTTELLWWNENTSHLVNDAVLGNDIRGSDSGESVDLDPDEAAISSDVNGKRSILEQSRQVDVEQSLPGELLHGLDVLFLGLVDGVGVESSPGYDVVLKKSLQVFGSILREQEGVDLWTELLERPVGWCKQGTARMIGGIEFVEQSSLAQAEL